MLTVSIDVSLEEIINRVSPYELNRISEMIEERRANLKPISYELTESEKSFALSDRIRAIRRYRFRTGKSLKDSRNAVYDFLGLTY